jgi:hypothetical protein
VQKGGTGVKAKRTVAAAVFVVIAAAAAFLLIRKQNYAFGREQGYLCGYSIGYADGRLAARENTQAAKQDSRSLAENAVPYELGSSKWNGFMIGFQVGYSDSFSAAESNGESSAAETLDASIPTIVYDGKIYFSTGKPITGEVDEGAIVGRITKVVTAIQWPAQDGAANFGQVGDPYAMTEDGFVVLVDQEWTLFMPGDINTEWGIALSVKDVSSTGLTLICSQHGGSPTGTILTGSNFAVLQEKNEQYEEVPCILPAEQVGWTGEAWDAEMNGVIAWEIQWEWPYGALEPGEYLLRKHFMNFRAAGDYDTATMTVLFTVPSVPQTQQIADDFSVRFSWWYVEDRKNIMDTETGQLQKDLLLDGTATAEFQPNQAFMQRLYDIVSEENLLTIQREMTSRELTKDNITVSVEPNCYYEIAVRMNGEDFIIRGDMSAESYRDIDEEALRFMRAVQDLMNTVRELPEWSSFPEGNGGYG